MEESSPSPLFPDTNGSMGVMDYDICVCASVRGVVFVKLPICGCSSARKYVPSTYLDCCTHPTLRSEWFTLRTKKIGKIRQLCFQNGAYSNSLPSLHFHQQLHRGQVHVWKQSTHIHARAHERTHACTQDCFRNCVHLH